MAQSTDSDSIDSIGLDSDDKLILYESSDDVSSDAWNPMLLSDHSDSENYDTDDKYDDDEEEDAGDNDNTNQTSKITESKITWKKHDTDLVCLFNLAINMSFWY